MNIVPALPVVKDNSLRSFYARILAGLRGVPDTLFYRQDGVVWQTPTDLDIADGTGTPRAEAPLVVRVAQARIPDDIYAAVPFAGVNWSWLGGDRIRILAVGGLTAGTRYDLLWEVVSGLSPVRTGR